MRIETTGDALRKAASWTARISPAKPFLPVLGGALLDAAMPTISASDMEVFGTVHLAGAGIEPGRAVVSAKLLAEIAESVPPATDVTITRTDQGRIRIKAGRTTWSLPEIDTPNWPLFPELGDLLGVVQAPELRRGIARVQPAADEKEMAELQAVDIRIGDRLTLACTDRFRLAVAEVDWTPKADAVDQLVIPRGMIRHLTEALKGAGEVTLYSTGDTVTLECSAMRITGRLLDKFVAWEGIAAKAAPEELSATVVTVEVSALRVAVAQAALVCKAKEALHLAISPDGMRITPPSSGRDESDGDADSQAEVISFTGEPITVRVNPGYLLDALTGLDEPCAEFRFGGDLDRQKREGRFFLLRPATRDGTILDGYQHVLMPFAGR